MKLSRVNADIFILLLAGSLQIKLVTSIITLLQSCNRRACYQILLHSITLEIASFNKSHVIFAEAGVVLTIHFMGVSANCFIFILFVRLKAGCRFINENKK